jgi:hypothetical protein
MNIGEELRDELLHGINSIIPDFWTIMFDQYGDVPMPVNVANNVGKKTIIPLIASMTNYHLRTVVHVENFFLHP